METLLLSEEIVSKFKFWWDGKVQTGMRFRSELFRSVSKFDIQHRQKVFELALSLSQDGAEVVVTVDRAQYTVWVELRSQHCLAHAPEQTRDELKLPQAC